MHNKTWGFNLKNPGTLDIFPALYFAVLTSCTFPELLFSVDFFGALSYAMLLGLANIRYEKLQRWDDALKAYTAKASQASSPHLALDATLGLSFIMQLCSSTA